MRLLTLVAVVTVSGLAHAGPACPPKLNVSAIDQMSSEEWDTFVSPTCRAIHGRTALTLIIDEATENDRPPSKTNRAYKGYAAVVDEHGAIVWQESWDREKPSVWRDWTLIDLDGDGQDELVENIDRKGPRGAADRLIVVHAIVDGIPTKRAPDGAMLMLSMTDGRLGETVCDSTWRFVRHGRGALVEVAGTLEQKYAYESAYCPANGKHVYRWDGATFVAK